MTKRAVFVGRWTPFHKGHLAIMQKKIDEGKPLLILVRDTPYDIYPPLMRKRMIESAMSKLKVDAKVMLIDDIESINYGRGVGYEVNEVKVPDNVKKISATEIRDLIEKNDSSWKEFIPEGADKVLEDYLTGKGIVVWFTGLPKSGKSAISELAAYKLEQRGIKSERLDGSTLRKTVSKDLGFSKQDRDLNLERAMYIAEMLSRNRAIVLCSFITPYESQRKNIRDELEKNGHYVEVHVKSSVEASKKRDEEGMYDKAEKGEIEDFTGVSQDYEEPESPDIVLDTEKKSVEDCAEEVVRFLEAML
ncbi:MAG: adenylyl-sulfate kinase [Candidatus Woesearchaeota archaeon]